MVDNERALDVGSLRRGTGTFQVAVGVKKPQEAQKAKALWAMKAAKDRREDFCDPARKDSILRRKKTRLELWEEHLKRPKCCAGQSLKNALKVSTEANVGSRLLWKHGGK